MSPPAVDEGRLLRTELAHHLCLVPWLDLGASLDTAAALAEVRALDDRFVREPQREDSDPVSKWASLTVWSSGGRTELAFYEDSPEAGAPPPSWTEFGRACPSLVTLLESVFDPTRADGIHVLRLSPGGRVFPHSDAPRRALCTSLNIALNMPSGVEFRIDSDASSVAAGFERVVPMQGGGAYVLNVARVHAVDHAGTEPRYHVVARTPVIDGLGPLDRRALVSRARAQNGWSSLEAVRSALEAATEAGRAPLPGPVIEAP